MALHCVTHARGPVVVVRPHQELASQPPTVVVGVDGSAESRIALAAAIEEAERMGAEVEVVAAYPVTDSWVDVYAASMAVNDEVRVDARRRADELLREVVGAVVPGPVVGLPPIRTVTAEGPAAEVLVDRARGGWGAGPDAAANRHAEPGRLATVGR